MKAILLFFLLSLPFCKSFSGGPGSCSIPLNAFTGSAGPHSPTGTAGTVSFSLSVGGNTQTGYTPGQVHTLTLTANQQINGFVLWAQKTGTSTRIGSMTGGAGTQDAFGYSGDPACGAAGTTLSHKGVLGSTQLTATFTAPPAGTGSISFSFIQVTQNSGTTLTATSAAFNEVVAQPTSAGATSKAAATSKATSTISLSKTATNLVTSAATSAAQVATSQNVGNPTSQAVVVTPQNNQAAQPVNNMPLSMGAAIGIGVGVGVVALLLLLGLIPVVIARMRRNQEGNKPSRFTRQP